MTKSRFFFILLAMLVVTLACSLVTGETVETEAPPDATDSLPGVKEFTPTSPLPDEPTAPAPPPTREPQATSERAPEYGVILVSEGDVLNVRSGPGVDYAVIDTLAPHATGITMAGDRQKVGNSMWVEVNTLSGTVGWVNAHFLTELVPQDDFCGDPRVNVLMDEFVAALQARDGGALSQLVSPAHGLSIRVSWWNPEVNFRGPDQVANIFADPQVYDWGIQDGSGFPIQGSFSDEIVPWLDDVLNAEFSRHCNDLENGSGASAGFIIWPYEYQNINDVALYRAAAPGEELNWRTWAVGVTYHQGRPYIAFLVQYHWEI